MHTFKYKNGYIHENIYSGRITAQIGWEIYQCKSIRAAKILITKHIDGELV